MFKILYGPIFLFLLITHLGMELLSHMENKLLRNSQIVFQSSYTIYNSTISVWRFQLCHSLIVFLLSIVQIIAILWCVMRYLIVFFFSFIFVSWRPITSQCCSGPCHTLMNQPWIYMYSPSRSPLPPPSRPHPSGSSQSKFFWMFYAVSHFQL